MTKVLTKNSFLIAIATIGFLMALVSTTMADVGTSHANIIDDDVVRLIDAGAVEVIVLDAAPAALEDAAPANLGDAGALVEGTSVPAEIAGTAEEGKGLAFEIFKRLKSSEWLIAFGGILVFVVWALRAFLAKRISWFGTKFGGITLAFGTAIFLSVGTALQAGAPVDLGLLTTALAAAWAASGGWGHLRDVMDGGGSTGDSKDA